MHAETKAIYPHVKINDKTLFQLKFSPLLYIFGLSYMYVLVRKGVYRLDQIV